MKGKIDWANHILQLIIVTLGILLAFTLNSWNETRKEKNLTRIYMLGLKEEILENKSEL